MGNRKKFTDYTVNEFRKAGNHAGSADALKTWLDSLTDAQFEELVTGIENGTTHLTYIFPNDLKEHVTTGTLLSLAEGVGAPVMSQLVTTDTKTGVSYTTNETHFIGYGPTRRQIQHKDDKISVAYDNNVRNLLTGQVTGASKGSSISAAQEEAILGRGCKYTALEFAKFRGGDIAAGSAFNSWLTKAGGADLDVLKDISSKPEVAYAAGLFLNGMHIQHNALTNTVAGPIKDKP